MTEINETTDKTEEMKTPLDQENSGKRLIPILNAKAVWHENKLEVINENINSLERKIMNNEQKLTMLKRRAEKLRSINEIIKASGLPFSGIIERNEAAIKRITEEKIPKREKKIETHKAAVAAYKEAASIRTHKLERIRALSDAVRYGVISIVPTREHRQAYARAMDALRQSTYDCLVDKRNALLQKQAEIIERTGKRVDKISAYDMASAKDQAKILRMLSKNNVRFEGDWSTAKLQLAFAEGQKATERLKIIDEKIKKLDIPKDFYAAKSDSQIDEAMKKTSDVISKSADGKKISIPEIAEEICESTAEAAAAEKKVDLSIDKQAEKPDAVIESDKDQKLNDLRLKRDELQKQIESLETKSKEPQIINADYYKSLPPDERMVNTMPSDIAKSLAAELERQNIPCSAVERKENMYSITVSIENAAAYREALSAVLEAANAKSVSNEKENSPALNAEKPEKDITVINQEFFYSNDQNDLYTAEVPTNCTKNIFDMLESMNIDYSAVIRNNGISGITVHKDFTDALDSMSGNFINEQSAENVKEFINKGYYMRIPPDARRTTKEMQESEAIAAVKNLESKGIKSSAVLDGDKSRVTVHKNNVTKSGLFSRSSLAKQERKNDSEKSKAAKSRQKQKNKINNKNVAK